VVRAHGAEHDLERRARDEEGSEERGERPAVPAQQERVRQHAEARRHEYARQEEGRLRYAEQEEGDVVREPANEAEVELVVPERRVSDDVLDDGELLVVVAEDRSAQEVPPHSEAYGEDQDRRKQLTPHHPASPLAVWPVGLSRSAPETTRAACTVTWFS